MPSTPTQGLRVIPRGIWALGLVSLFMDTSSELIHSLLPVFLVTTLGTSASTLGWVEGIAEATAALTKMFAGALSDYLGRRKALAVFGYALSALTKPLFPLATAVGWVFTARFLDRVGKGIRGAPRDALIGDLAPSHLRGACYGLRQTLDTVGAFTGPLLAVALLAWWTDDLRSVLWVAVIPALLAVVILVLGVEEPVHIGAGPVRKPLRLADLPRLGGAYWWLVGVSTLFGLARFSEAFLLLRAEQIGLAVALVPLVLVAMNVVYALSAYPAGLWSDRIGRRKVLALGFAALIVADGVLARADGPLALTAGVALWGLHMGLTQGLLAALITDTAPVGQRGTAFGVFHLSGGLALLVASVLAGWLWDHWGPGATFHFGAVIAALALAAWLLPIRRPAG